MMHVSLLVCYNANKVAGYLLNFLSGNTLFLASLTQLVSTQPRDSLSLISWWQQSHLISRKDSWPHKFTSENWQLSYSWLVLSSLFLPGHHWIIRTVVHWFEQVKQLDRSVVGLDSSLKLGKVIIKDMQNVPWSKVTFWYCHWNVRFRSIEVDDPKASRVLSF